MKDKTYMARYKTGKRGILFAGLLIVPFVVLVIICFAANSGFSSLAVVLLLFSIGALYLSIRGYREIRLYYNRMEVVGVIYGIISQVWYSEIEHIGFVKARTAYNSRGFRVGGKTTNPPISELIILQKNGRRDMFGDDAYDHLQDVHDFIMQQLPHLR